MKKLWLIITVIFPFVFVSVLTAQNISPQFSEIKGMEDIQGNTHLLYRIYSHQSGPGYESGSNDIYNLVTGTTIDTIYFYDGYTCSPFMGWGETVIDYDFWDNDLTKFIYAGDHVTCFEPGPFISRFDSAFVYNDWLTYTQEIFISKQNDSLVFALPNLISNDGGFNWDTLQLEHQPISIAEYDDKTYFSNEYLSYTSAIYKSTDGGNSYALVDTGGSNWDPKFFYDVDGNHIYRTHTIDYPNRSLKGSANQGNAFTWQTLYETSNDFFVCLDESQSGAIYLADGNKIFYSSDYGNTFNLYKELDNRIVGIYKKPNSDKLYAATKYRIYDITYDSIVVIKSLPIPEEILAYYPLAVGNKWVYYYLFVDWNSTGYQDIYLREIQSLEVKPNGKEYFKIRERYVQMGFESIVYERIDSVEGKVYRYNEYCPNSEEFIEDLVMDVGDSTYAARFGYCIEHPPTELLSEQYFNNWNNWGIEGKRRNYPYVELVTADYFLSTEIGLDYFRLDDDNGWKEFSIKGMVKNGVVYGDTTLTDVGDENNSIPTVYRLEQNYPNPFNPTTKIRWQSPSAGYQTLKVYDVLGNEVITLVDEFRNAGTYEIDFDASKLSSGVYFYQLKSGDFISTKKLILLK
jgi:hypothetical protein